MDPKKTGELIATLRRERNLNQSELAEHIGVTNKAISRWETGRGYPDIETLPKLSEVLGISIPELLEGERFQRLVSDIGEVSNTKQQEAVQFDTSIDTVFRFAGEETKKQKKKIRRLTVLLSAAIGLFALYWIVTEVFPVAGQIIYSVVGSSDCVVASDYGSMNYLGDTYVPLPMNGYSCFLGERMVDECRVEGTGFFGKLLFGEMLYEVENVPNHEILYLQTDYDECISEYFVLETEYERYCEILQQLDCNRYYSSHYNESWYQWDEKLDDNISNAIRNPENAPVTFEPDIVRKLDIRLYDENQMFFYEAGVLVQADGGFYWCPAEFPSHGYGLHEGCTWKEQYYPIIGFDDELSELFSN